MSFELPDLEALLGFALSEEQRAVVVAPLGSQLVVAGAGSGKTTVMAARVVWLVARGEVPAERVLGLTFTRKAAAELADRTRRWLALLPAPLRPAPGLLPAVSTYDAYAGRLVAEHGVRLGLEPRDDVVADARRHLLAERVLARHTRAGTHLRHQLDQTVVTLVGLDTALSDQVQEPDHVATVETARAASLDAALEVAVAEGATAELRRRIAQARDTSRCRAELAGLVGELRQLRRERGLTDFGDRTVAAVRLAEQRPEVGLAERERFDVVLLDEYQDTSVAQARLLSGLFRDHPVTAVGDPCQAIYGWRGASASNLVRFPAAFAGEPATVRELQLQTSRRSGEHILAVANAISGPLREDGARVVELAVADALAGAGEVVTALHASWADEVAWVAARLRASIDAGRAPRDHAVLLRRRDVMPSVVAALEAQGVPVQVSGLTGLLGQPEVADVVAHLQAVDDPAANVAWLRVLRGPRWRLGQRDLAVLARRARALARPTRATEAEATVSPLVTAVATVDRCDVAGLGEAVASPGPGLSAEAAERVTRLAAEMATLRESAAGGVLDLVRRVVEVTGLDVEVAATPRSVAARRRDQLAAFLEVAAGWSDPDGPGSLRGFLAFLRAGEEHERGLPLAERAGTDVDVDAVKVLTVHAAKGLEWPVVAVPAVCGGVFPDLTRRSLWTSQADELPPDLRADGDQVPGLGDAGEQAWAHFDAASKAEVEREERRLAYVALTRAAGTLLVSGHAWGPTQRKARGPSPYLALLRDEVLADPRRGRVETWVEPDCADPRQPTDPHAVAAQRAPLLRAAAEVRALTDTPALTEELAALVAEARQTRRRVREVPLPRTLTASQVVRLSTEPDALAASLARPLPRRPSPAASRGTAFHAWVEQRFGQHALLDPGELPGEDDQASADGLAELQEAFLASRWADLAPHAVEAPFATVVAGHLLRGRIDAVYAHPRSDGTTGWEVVDWKTGAEGADPVQLAVYRLAWARQVDVPLEQVTATFCYVETGRDVQPPLLDEAGLTALLRGPAAAPGDRPPAAARSWPGSR